MDVTITTAEGSGADLCRWLAADPPVRSFAANARPADREPGDGAMGTGFDLLNLIVPNAIALAGLFTSLAAFRDQRRRSTGTALQITVTSGGVTVVVNESANPHILLPTGPPPPTAPVSDPVSGPASVPAPAAPVPGEVPPVSAASASVSSEASTSTSVPSRAPAASVSDPASDPASGAASGAVPAPPEAVG